MFLFLYVHIVTSLSVTPTGRVVRLSLERQKQIPKTGKINHYNFSDIISP